MSKIPINWKETTWNAVISQISNGITNKQNKTGIGIPVTRIETISKENINLEKVGYVQDLASSDIEKYRLRDNDILLSHINSDIHLGKAAIYTEKHGPLFHGTNLLRIRINMDLCYPKYFLYHSKKQRLDSVFILNAQHAVNQSSINQSKLKELSFLLPPFDEQRRIVAKLDSLSAKSRHASEELSHIPRLVERYKQAILAKAFSGDLTADWRRRRGLSLDWQEITLGDVLPDLRYGTSKKCDYTPTDTPVLRIPNITETGIVLDDLKYASFTKAERDGLALKPGDILIIRSNGSVDLVGRAALVTEKAAGYLYAGYLMRLRFSSAVDPHFILYYLREPSIRRQIETLAKSTSGVNNINSQEVKSLPLKRPSIEEQREIVSRIELDLKRINHIVAEAQRAYALLDRLDQATLAKAFRGELVPQTVNKVLEESLV